MRKLDFQDAVMFLLIAGLAVTCFWLLSIIEANKLNYLDRLAYQQQQIATLTFHVNTHVDTIERMQKELEDRP